jgi:hypothetical protein
LGLNANECIILEAGYMSTTVNHTENIDWIVKEEAKSRNAWIGIDLISSAYYARTTHQGSPSGCFASLDPASLVFNMSSKPYCF